MIKEPKVFPMMKHTELINAIAEKIKANSYLEIGVYSREHNFDRINIKDKSGTDPALKDDPIIHPMTSDEFFALHQKEIKRTEFDIIFIDGLHHSDQVRKDIINSWACLNDGGCIILHDTNPHSENITHVPRDNREWCGDVYKSVCQIESPEIFTLNDDYGVTVIRKTPGAELKLNDDVVTWEEFDMFRNDILNLKSWEEITSIIDKW